MTGVQGFGPSQAAPRSNEPTPWVKIEDGFNERHLRWNPQEGKAQMQMRDVGATPVIIGTSIGAALTAGGFGVHATGRSVMRAAVLEHTDEGLHALRTARNLGRAGIGAMAAGLAAIAGGVTIGALNPDTQIMPVDMTHAEFLRRTSVVPSWA